MKIFGAVLYKLIQFRVNLYEFVHLIDLWNLTESCTWGGAEPGTDFALSINRPIPGMVFAFWTWLIAVTNCYNKLIAILGDRRIMNSLDQEGATKND